jgi:hypothetical protein
MTAETTLLAASPYFQDPELPGLSLNLPPGLP